MTRSSARRRNRNARAIAALVPAKDALHHRTTEGAFTPHDARRWVHNASPYLWPEPPQETNWELCAELLNKKARCLAAALRREADLISEIANGGLTGREVTGAVPIPQLTMVADALSHPRHARAVLKTPPPTFWNIS